MADKNIPNNGIFSTADCGSSVPMGRMASTTNPPNEGTWTSDAARGSFPDGRMASTCNPPNNGIFRDGDPGFSGDGRMPAASQPGPGAVPVSGMRVGDASTGMAKSDSPKGGTGPKGSPTAAPKRGGMTRGK